jgi:very-short-patch-repair endonuclease
MNDGARPARAPNPRPLPSREGEPANGHTSARPEGIVTRQRVAPTKLKLARAMRGAPTFEEALLWHRLRRNQLNGLHFRRQQVIDGFIVDFYCYKAALAIEVDGRIHLANPDYDRERDRVLCERGVATLRVSAEDVRSRMPAVLQRIVEAGSERMPSSTNRHTGSPSL